MSQAQHGMHSFHGRNQLEDFQCIKAENPGRFGRMFPDLHPLYCNPSILAAMGAVNGLMDGKSPAALTSTVPLGMIFFGQFIDHDLTFDTTSSFSNINDPNEIKNNRSPRLDLDCVFGEGPEDEPFMYLNDPVDYHLLTGSTNHNFGQGPGLEKNDLARNGVGRAVIGDPRNDENRIVSQFQLAMIRFYNAVYTDVAAANPGMSASDIYKAARKIVTWHYQWIVVNEYLPLICGKKIVNDILSNGRQFYKPQGLAFIPVEFSVAAYRFGHSMIAQTLKVQSAGTAHSIFSPQLGLGFSRISNANQVVEWDLFFDITGGHQKAEKLDTKLASDLLNLPFVNSTNPADKSLATRNLRRGQSFLLPSGEHVAESMAIEGSDISSVKNLINNICSASGIDLPNGTPLWFYILAEAEEVGRVDTQGSSVPGEGLGPVGGTLVAEVIIGLMELDPDSFLCTNRDWLPTLGSNGTFLMKDLIAKAATAM